MWNVSGVTGAAPVWVEVIGFLHRGEAGVQERPPARVVEKEVEFSRGAEPSRREWFIQGTEPGSRNRRAGQLNPRIIYPPSGTVIALDPDIPPDLQKVFFISQSNEEGLRWSLNGSRMEGNAGALPWSPTAGRFLLSLSDREGRTVDSVHFEVRGPAGE